MLIRPFPLEICDFRLRIELFSATAFYRLINFGSLPSKQWHRNDAQLKLSCSVKNVEMAKFIQKPQSTAVVGENISRR